MLWYLFLGLCGAISFIFVENKLKIKAFSLKGISILLIIYFMIEFIRYLVMK